MRRRARDRRLLQQEAGELVDPPVELGVGEPGVAEYQRGLVGAVAGPLGQQVGDRVVADVVFGRPPLSGQGLPLGG